MDPQALFTPVVEYLLKEHGHCYLDQHVARAFSKLSGQPEEDTLNVLRRQENDCLVEESGRGKYQRARERACMLLASGWDQGAEGCRYTPPQLFARLEPATAYGIVARACRDWD